MTFQTNQRVALDPSLDAWMMGIRYGNVVKHDPKRRSPNTVQVALDTINRVVWMPADVLHPVGS